MGNSQRAPKDTEMADDGVLEGGSTGVRERAAAFAARAQANLRDLTQTIEQLTELLAQSEHELEDLRLIHETVVEHSTTIENELSETNEVLKRTNQQIHEELLVAAQVQTALLPRVPSDMEAELDIAVYHKQLTEVGGDYYDFFRMPGDRYAMGVFDISGHGASAALIMSFLKAQFTQVMEYLDTPQGIVEWVNKTSIDFLKEIRRYATINFVTFEEGFIRYVSGGGYGLVLHEGVPCLFNKKNHFLGLRLKPYQEFQLSFDVGDLMALYTDGMIEAQNNQGLDYGAHRLNELILRNRDKPVQEIVDLCVSDYESFREADSDDITLIVLRKKA